MSDIASRLNKYQQTAMTPKHELFGKPKLGALNLTYPGTKQPTGGGKASKRQRTEWGSIIAADEGMWEASCKSDVGS